MLDPTATMFLLIGALVASQIIGRKAFSALTPEQKLTLMESSQGFPWMLIFIGAAYGLQFWLIEVFGFSATLVGGFMLIAICGLLLSFIMMVRRLQRRSVPLSYLRTLTIAQIPVLLALMLMLWSNYRTMSDVDTRVQRTLDEISKKDTGEQGGGGQPATRPESK